MNRNYYQANEKETIPGSFFQNHYLLTFAFDASARFLKRSTRPAVSSTFSLPVKNGWH